MSRWKLQLCCLLLSLWGMQAFSEEGVGTRGREAYRVIKGELDRVGAIDTHDHLWPFEKLPGFNETKQGKGMNLAGIWRNSYYTWYNPLTPWEKGMEFDAWWGKAKHDFKNARSTSFYRYHLPAFEALYGVDFDRITDEEARELDRKIFENYKDQKWLYEVITEKANIELMFNDPYWARLEFTTYYPWEVLVFNVTSLVRGFHASEFSQPADSPYVFAQKHGLPMDTFDDYLKVLDHLFLTAKDNNAVCLKTTLAYQRTLHFENVPRERAEKAFGKRASVLTSAEIKDFEDYIIWRICELSAKYELPFQIHTGQARIQGSNPMLLVDMIEANRKTKFILFHGGYPWVGETAVIAQKNKNVWIDSVWLPMLSYSMGKRALHEWLDSFPSNRIMWGADCNHAEGI
ncbi:MAG: amidohydrolase family protein, partial [Planctomycetaceae bacterium]|nr:amidohydrolase family protein [Planctomycetaceae bacterium]